MFFHEKASGLETAPSVMDARLRARLTRGEFFALAFLFCMAGIFAWIQSRISFPPYDYAIYFRAAQGDLLQFYYAEWSLPLFWLLAKLPFTAGYLVWAGLNIVCIFFAARVFGGKAPLAFLTFQMFCVLFLGQITGILIGGLALGWWGMAHRRWHAAGLGFLLAAAKFHAGLAFGPLLWLAAEIPWRDRLRVLLVPAAGTLLSLLFHPSWPLDLLERMQDYPPYDWASISLWQYFGAWALLFLLPPLALPLPRRTRLLSMAAACTFALPYFQQADLLALFILPVGWLPSLLGNLGFLFFEYQYDALRMLWGIPLIIYLSLILPASYHTMRRFWTSRLMPPTPKGSAP